MSETNIDVVKADVERMKIDIDDIKTNAKEQAIAMLSMRDSHTETKIYINQIRESQNAMAKEAKDNQAFLAQEARLVAEKTERNQIATMKAIQEMKDEKINMWKQLNMAGKIAVVGLIVSYIGGIVLKVLQSIPQ